MKGEYMNLAKGFKRLTLVLSFLVGPIVFLYFLVVDTPGPETSFFVLFVALLVLEISGFVAVWIAYWIVLFVVKGFRDKKVKDERKLNLGRGFRRIIFTLAIVVAICCANFSVVLIMDTAKSEWAWKQQEYDKKYYLMRRCPMVFVWNWSWMKRKSPN